MCGQYEITSITLPPSLWEPNVADWRLHFDLIWICQTSNVTLFIIKHDLGNYEVIAGMSMAWDVDTMFIKEKYRGSNIFAGTYLNTSSIALSINNTG